MKTNIIQIGNSKGVRIPKALLVQLEFGPDVELEVVPEGLLLRPVRRPPEAVAPRAGWAQAFQTALAEDGDDTQEFAAWHEASLTSFDDEEW